MGSWVGLGLRLGRGLGLGLRLGLGFGTLLPCTILLLVVGSLDFGSALAVFLKLDFLGIWTFLVLGSRSLFG